MRPFAPPHAWAFVAAAMLTSGLSACAVHGQSETSSSDDAKMAADVSKLLDQHPELGPPNQIYVRAHDHVVYLSGMVGTSLQRDTALSAARQATGVHQVINQMGVSYEGR
jgi:osmotically-inducible protein OsmY